MKYTISIIITFLVFITNIIYSQNSDLSSVCSSEELDNYWAEVGKYINSFEEKEIYYTINTLKTIKKCTDRDSLGLHYIASNIYASWLSIDVGELDSVYLCLKDAERGLSKYELSLPKDDVYGMKAEINYIYGIYFRNKGNIELALSFFQKSIDLFLEQVDYKEGTDIDPSKLAYNFRFKTSDVFSYAAFMYYILGDFEKAIEYDKITIELAKLNDIDNYSDENRAFIYQNLCKGYVGKEDYESAGHCYNKVLDFLSKPELLNSEKNIGLIYKNIAIYNQRIQNYKATQEYIDKALSLENRPEYDIYIHQDIGKIYSDFGKYDKSISFLDTAHLKIIDFYGYFHQRLALNYKFKGELSYRQKEYETADSLYNTGINILLGKKSNQCSCGNVEISQLNNKRVALDIIRKKADLNFESGNLNESVDCFLLLDELTKEYQSKYIFSEESKYFFLKKTKGMYEAAINTALLNNDKEAAYQFCQSSRSMILLSQVQDKKAVQTTGIPDSIAAYGESLKLKINTFQKSREEAILENDETKIKEWDSKLFTQRKIYDNWMKDLEDSYPLYYELKHNAQSVSLKSLQENLKKNQSTLIEYFVGEDKLYVFVIDGNTINVNNEKIDSTFNQNIISLNKCISKVDYRYNSFKEFNQSSSDLYKTLLDKAFDENWIVNQDLIIIPDEQLNLIPFEVLIKEKLVSNDTFPKYHQLNYLVQSHNISYHYSSNLILSGNRNINKNRIDLLGIAPTFGKRNIQELENNISEIQEAAAYYNQAKLIDENNADVASALDNINNCRIAHFATHAIFNDQIPLDSRIELADTSLYIYEIFGMEHNLDLAIISACETASGKQRKGEGVISLSRAFIQSGCPSVIASLWSVSDQKTSMLMKNFHEYFSSGDMNQSSLSEAKRKYISEAMTKNVHPFYWAGFIQVGTVNNNVESNFALYVGIAIVLLLLLLIVFFYMKKAKSK